MKRAILILSLTLLAGSAISQPVLVPATHLTNVVTLTNYVYVPVLQPPVAPVAPAPTEDTPGRLLPFAYGDLVTLVLGFLASLYAWWKKVRAEKTSVVLVDNLNTAKKTMTPAAKEEFVEKIKEDQRDGGVRQEVLKLYKPEAEGSRVGP